MKLSLYSGNLSTYYKSITLVEGKNSCMVFNKNTGKLATKGFSISSNFNVVAEMSFSTLEAKFKKYLPLVISCLN